MINFEASETAIPPIDEANAKDFLQGFASQNRKVVMRGVPLNPHRSFKVYNHSPDGFNWGYGGSGAAQLALAILLELVNEQQAVKLYQDFKWDVIANLPSGKDFVIPMVSIEKWVELKTKKFVIDTDKRDLAGETVPIEVAIENFEKNSKNI